MESLAAGLTIGKKPKEPIPTQLEEARSWLESGMVLTEVVKGGRRSRGADEDGARSPDCSGPKGRRRSIV